LDFSPEVYIKNILFVLCLPLMLFGEPGNEVIKTVAVMDFENVTKDEKIDWLKLGISETIISDLKNINSINVVERMQLAKVMQEQALGQTGIIDEASAVKVGNILGADLLVLGSFQKAKNNLRITARLVEAESGKVQETVKATGPMDDVFSLQDQIVLKIASAFNIEVDEETRKSIEVKKTSSVGAYEYYAKGKNAYDEVIGKASILRPNETKELYLKAIAFYDKAIAQDAEYALAYLDRAACLYNIKKRAAAASDLEIAEKHQNNVSKRERYWINIKYNALAKKDFAEAEKVCKSVLVHYPSDITALWYH